jgi:uracil-DNA glycosylase
MKFYSWRDLGWWHASSMSGKSGDQRMRQKLQELGDEFLPAWPDVYRALEITAFDQVRVVILGQDPYPTPGQAHGLAFSVPNGINNVPPTLKNIKHELREDLKLRWDDLKNTDLAPWAKQGVLLLNAVLTVKPGEPGSHAGLGWETLTRGVLRAIGEHREEVVFVLWGRQAERVFTECVEDDFGAWRKQRGHTVLRSAHPSPRSAERGFFGSRPFSRINQALKVPIDWRL